MQSTQSTPRPGTSPPRARVTLSIRELALGLGILAIGAVMTWQWLHSRDGHTGRRLLTGLMALVIGVAAMALSVRRACSACGTALAMFNVRAAPGLVPVIEQSFSGGDGPAFARLLRQVLSESANASAAAACAVAYCGGCRGVLTLRCAEGRGFARRQVISGDLATGVIPFVEMVVHEERGRRRGRGDEA